MKKLLRKYLTNLVTFWLTSNLALLFVIGHSFPTLFLAALGFTLLDLIVKPALKVVFLPINLITLGLLRWVPAVIIFYLVTLITPGYGVHTFSTQPFTFANLSFPSFHFGQISSLIIATLIIYLTKRAVIWINKKDKD